jgi:hypothetical protein
LKKSRKLKELNIGRMSLDDFIQLMNKYGSEKEPFMFIIDFDMKCPEIHQELNSRLLFFQMLVRITAIMNLLRL